MIPSSAPIRPLIMCGGSGTRLWPVSRETLPKQFARLTGERSTFQETLLRVADPALFGRPLVIANRVHRDTITGQAREIGVDIDMVLEPFARDSAPAIIAGTLAIANATPGSLVLVLAADHLVRDPEGFRDTVRRGYRAASEGAIVTFGIVPTFPSTAYGYIAPGEVFSGDARRVARFIEKPDLDTAGTLVANGYFWNSGNFMFRPDTVLKEYAEADPESLAAIRGALAAAARDGDVLALSEADFQRARKISFDFAIMENTANATIVSGDFGWSDIGGWDALWSVSPKDSSGNASFGDAVLMDTAGSYARSDGPLMVLVGMRDVVAVASGDAILVADRARAGEVKDAVESLRRAGRPEARAHRLVHESWGVREVLHAHARGRTIRLVLRPGATMARPMNSACPCQWIIVAGTGRITIGARDLEAGPGSHAVIAPRAAARIVNHGPGDLEAIEVEFTPAG